jgi:alpha-tubulin suppressor-like RCC1 family protein
MADGHVRCWGRNAEGEAGTPATPDRVKPTVIEGVADAVAIAAGATFTCALSQNKTVSCWGTGRILGDGKERAKLAPTAIPGISGVEQIRAAGLVTCARTSTGGVRCWGLESDATRRATTTDIAELAGATDIAAASAHACARTTHGTVRCWGDFGWAVGSSQAMQRPPVQGAELIASGDDFVCAVTSANKVACWGRNDRGQLGKAPDDDVHANVSEVPGISGAAAVAAGEGQACAVLKGGGVTCWGANEEGELGIGTRTTSELPQPGVKGLTSVRDVCIGSEHACARTETGDVFCWGANHSGQIGDGTRERSLVPKRVDLGS